MKTNILFLARFILAIYCFVCIWPPQGYASLNEKDDFNYEQLVISEAQYFPGGCQIVCVSSQI